MHRSRHRLATALAGAVALLTMAVPAAQAGPLVASAAGCAEQKLVRPFLPWLDIAQYVIAPNGDLEHGTAGWSLSGGAAGASGNEPWHVTAASDHRSLRLPAGASATTAAMCVGIEHPTLRFFAKGDGGALGSALKVEVLFEDAAGAVHALTIGQTLPGAWSPTPVYPVVANMLALLPGEKTAVAFRFTSVGTGTWTIDDVYVDPYAKH